MCCMRRLWILLLLLPIACRALTPTPLTRPTLNPIPYTAVTTATPNPSATPRLEPTATNTAVPTIELPTATPIAETQNTITVRYHPDGPLFVGDLVSIEVIAPAGSGTEKQSVEVQVDSSPGAGPLKADFDNFGIGDRRQATLLWAWDTSGLSVGEHSLTFSIQPGGASWTETVSLLPQDQVPPPEPQAHWAVDENDCCLVYTITGTDAARDLPVLLQMTDEQAQKVTRSFSTELDKAIPIVFLPRVLGHGGFTSNEIAVSYLDRNYAGGKSDMVVHHEMVHLVDSRLGGDLRPIMLVEGLAVYLSGGHFKPEPLMPRAAALLPPEPGCKPASQANGETPGSAPVEICSLDWYLPLTPLIDRFYLSQHEIGYLQAGALVEFMVNTWGWQAYSDFYRDIHPQNTPQPNENENGPQAKAMQAALEAHFGLSLAQLEERYLQALRQEALTVQNVEDVYLTVEFYNTMRRYQQILDPSAYFLTAWLPDSEQMRKRGIVADYLRRPSQPENFALETMLVAADAALLSGDFTRVGGLLAEINAVLDVYGRDSVIPLITNPLAGYSLVPAFTGIQSPGLP